MAAVARFFAMGGFAGFVWPAYAVAFVVLGGFVLYSLRRYRAALTALADWESRL
jgi:heme exporter protein CcmD